MKQIIVIRALANGLWEIRVLIEKDEGPHHRKEKTMSRLNEKGPGLVEYILIVVIMGVLAIAAIHSLSSETQNGYQKATNKLSREFNI